MRIYLVRHGQSANNAAWAATGSAEGRVPEPALTALGRTQARAVARWFTKLPAEQRPTHLYSSLMSRAVMTADPIAKALEMPVIGRTDCFEVGGPYETGIDGTRTHHPGMTGAALAALTPRLVLPPMGEDEGWWTGPYETPAETVTRARRLVAELRTLHERDDIIALVTHQAFCQPLIAAMMGMDETPDGWFLVGNSGVCAFDVVGDEVDCLWINRRDHLRESQHTG